MKKMAIVASVVVAAFGAFAAFKIDRSVMSDAYWRIWNDAEQAKIDSEIEKNRKADADVEVSAPDGADVKVEQITHDFRFGAHIFNFNQLGKTEYNDAYKASYGEGGLFNQATVAFYWREFEPVPGRLRMGGDYEDTERFWNSIPRDEAMSHKFWRRPATGPVISFLKEKDVHIHGHILVWGSAKPEWIYDWYCPEKEKRAFDAVGVPRHSSAKDLPPVACWEGAYNMEWRKRWWDVYQKYDERQIAAMAPTFVKNMRRLFRKRVFEIADAYGDVVDSWDVVNESSWDWSKYRRSRTFFPVWKSSYGLMPGDYPLDALLDCKEAFPASANLAINDYHINSNFLAQVSDLDTHGVKIDIVGCQMHIFNTNDSMRLSRGAVDVKWVGTPATIRERLDLMARTGRPLHISEVTIAAPGEDVRSKKIQAVLARNIYRAWFSHPKTMGVTWWNTVDGGAVKGEALVSGLFSPDMTRKPVYHALDDLINREWKTVTSVKAKGGRVSFRGFKGRYRLTWRDASGAERSSFAEVR